MDQICLYETDSTSPSFMWKAFELRMLPLCFLSLLVYSIFYLHPPVEGIFQEGRNLEFRVNVGYQNCHLTPIGYVGFEFTYVGCGNLNFTLNWGVGIAIPP